MAYSNLGLQEPSTITARVATVTVARGSTTEHQEIMVIGDANSSIGIARVLAATPASTEYGLAVRVVEQPSTQVTIGSFASLVSSAVPAGNSSALTVRNVWSSTNTDQPVSAAQAGSWTVRANLSSTSTDNPVSAVQSGSWTVRATLSSTNADNPVRAILSSTSTDNPVSAAQSGSWTVRANLSSTSTDNKVAIGGALDSSGGLVTIGDSANNAIKVNVVAGAAGGSTIVTVSTIQGVVSVAATTSANSSAYLPVRLTDGTSFISVSADYTDGSTYTTLTGPGLAFNNSSNNTFRTVGLTTPFPVQVTDSSNAAVKVGDSANNALRVNVVAGAAGGSTIVTVSTGSVGLAGVYDSSGGLVKVGDSANNALKVNVVAGAAGGSTIVTVSTIQGVVSVAATTSANSSAYLPIRLTNGTAFLTPSVDYVQGSTFTSTTVQGPAYLMRAGASSVSSSDTFVLPWASTIGAQYIIPVTDAGVSVMDSTNRAINVNVVAGAAGGSTIVTVSTIQGKVAVVNSSAADLLVRPIFSSTGTDNPVSAAQAGSWTVRATLSSTSADNPVRANLSSTAADNPVLASLSLGTLQSSAVANSNSSALLVRVVAHGSSAVDFPVRAVLSSTSADNPVTATLNLGGLQSSAVANSNSSALLVRVVAHGSSAADFPVLATIGTQLQSTAAPSSNSSGLIVRQVVDNILTTVSTNAFSASTALTIQSSGASLRSYVTAYSILSTNAGPHKIKFSAGSTALWPVIFAAVSSAVSGANLAVSAPAYLFRTAAADPLTLNLSGGASTIGGYQVAVSYFRAP